MYIFSFYNIFSYPSLICRILNKLFEDCIFYLTVKGSPNSLKVCKIEPNGKRYTGCFVFMHFYINKLKL